MNCNCHNNNFMLGTCAPTCGKPECKEQPCACPEPVLAIEQVPDLVSVLRFNIDGKTTTYDYQNLVYQTQSDTVLVADLINRLLQYTAERHTDTITAQDLGSILHLADIGDVTTVGATDGSMLVYQKNNNCAEGCVGLNDTWRIWNALDQSNVATDLQFGLGFDINGNLKTLTTPADPTKHYNLSWNAQNKLSYTTPRITGAPEAGLIPLYMDPNTFEIIAVRNN